MDAKVRTHLTKALDLVLDVICIVDADGRFVAISAACEQVFGYQPEELIGQPMIDLVFPADRERTLAAATGVMAGHPLRNFENRYLRKDGQVIDIMWSARWSETDQLRLAVAREVTLRKRTESMQTALYSISEAAHSAEDLTDLLRRIHQILGGMLSIGGFMVALQNQGSDEMIFPYCAGDGGASAARKRDAAILAAEVVRTGAAFLLRQEFGDAWPQGMNDSAGEDCVDWLGVPLTANQRTIGALVVCNHAALVRFSEQDRTLLQFVSTQIADNIERKQANARLQYMAQYDVLTGLPNRALFDDRLRMALLKAERDKEQLSMLYLDLDDFKPVNDSYGHAVGDVLLQEVAMRIRACVRESDTVSRIGGDEFVVLLNTIRAPQNALDVAENIRAALRQPFSLPGQRVQIATSIGIANYPEHGTDQKQLARNADSAMYAAKSGGGNRCQVYLGQGLLD